MPMRREFEVHILSEDGIKAAEELAGRFSELLNEIVIIAGQDADLHCLAIVRTKLEEACFFAKKAMASNPQFQK